MSRSAHAGWPAPESAEAPEMPEKPGEAGADGTPRPAPGSRPPLSLLGRLRQWWSRLMARPSFRKWTAAFPLTRPVALARSREAFDLAAGFVYSQTLLALVRLEVLDLLLERPMTAGGVARATGIGHRGAERLLRAGVAIRVLREEEGDLFGLGPLGAPLAANPAFRALLEHNVLLYDELRDPVPLFRDERGTALPRYWPYGDAESRDRLRDEQVAPYSTFMAASQPLVASELLDAYPFRHHRRVMDVGGGEGIFLSHLGQRVPDVDLHLFELPPVAERGRRRLTDAGLEGRTTITAGDFLRDPLPRGADAITLIRILHDHDDDEVRTILRRCREALPPGGTLVVAEPMDTGGSGRVGAAYFGLYLLAMGRGAPRSPDRLRTLLRDAGFGRVRRPRARTPVLTSLLIGSP